MRADQMIGGRVAQQAVHPTLRGAAAAAVTAILLLLAGGCATGSKASSDADKGMMTEQVRPGAAGWSEHALRLPKEAPIVVTAQLDQVLMTLDDAWDWVIAEPAMLGDNGERMVAFLQAERQKFTGAEGLDPLSPEAWIDLGIDVTRKLYVGTYPVTDEDSRGTLEAVDRVVRDDVGLDDDDPVGQALTAAAVLSGDEPLQIYGPVSQELDGLDPLAGFRMVVPLADSEKFLSSLQDFLSDLELEQVDPPSSIVGQSDTAILFIAPDLDFHGILVRVRGDTATVDFLQEPMAARAVGMGRDQTRQSVIDRVERLVQAFPYGRPSAPAPVGEPIAGISVDQKGAADFAMIRGIRRALSEARGAGLQERNARFTYNLFRAFESAENWTIASNRLTGLGYGIFVGEAGRLVRLGIDLFGAGRDEPLPISEPAVDIAASERSLAASVDIRPMVDDAWQEWIGVDAPLDAVDSFDSIDFDAALFMLSFPRSLAILFTNAEKVFENRLPDWAEPLYAQRELLARLDVATAGIDIRGMRLTPRVVGVLTLQPGLADEQVDALGESMAAALANLSSQADAVRKRDESPAGDAQEESAGPPALAQPRPQDAAEESEQEPLKPAPLGRGTMQALTVDGETLGDVHYFWRHDGDQPYLFFSYGLDAEQADREHSRVKASDAAEEYRIMLFRAEPVALFSLLTFYDSDLFEPLDVGILSQRIGALSFEVTPELRGGVQRIRYDFVIGEPPKLEGGGASKP